MSEGNSPRIPISFSITSLRQRSKERRSWSSASHLGTLENDHANRSSFSRWQGGGDSECSVSAQISGYLITERHLRFLLPSLPSDEHNASIDDLILTMSSWDS
ncbi:hypothetical protein C2845_PM03G07880 [Panicum miliaceum]|uniref:Uncharacterized protein n=1 Tax=Panicum miliaceum TaxID=4540 RepID=A0A3L6TG86_PANMI|nr:hypothetical protein C2845_PM03G07880 [Panicum miliaceum]